MAKVYFCKKDEAVYVMIKYEYGTAYLKFNKAKENDYSVKRLDNNTINKAGIVFDEINAREFSESDLDELSICKETGIVKSDNASYFMLLIKQFMNLKSIEKSDDSYSPMSIDMSETSSSSDEFKIEFQPLSHQSKKNENIDPVLDSSSNIFLKLMSGSASNSTIPPVISAQQVVVNQQIASTKILEQDSNPVQLTIQQRAADENQNASKTINKNRGVLSTLLKYLNKAAIWLAEGVDSLLPAATNKFFTAENRGNRCSWIKQESQGIFNCKI